MLVTPMDHANRKLDLTVEDEGLPAALTFLARMDAGWKDFRGKDPFRRAEDPVRLVWKKSEAGTGVYVGTGFPDDEKDGWTVLPARARTRSLASSIRKALEAAPEPASDPDDNAVPGWRLREPMAAAWDLEDEPEDFEGAFAFVEKYACSKPQ